MSAPYRVVLLRHGQSTWNQQNLFTGWVDVRLSEQGASEAARAGVLLKDAGLLPDVLHTSCSPAPSRPRTSHSTKRTAHGSR